MSEWHTKFSSSSFSRWRTFVCAVGHVFSDCNKFPLFLRWPRRTSTYYVIPVSFRSGRTILTYGASEKRIEALLANYRTEFYRIHFYILQGVCSFCEFVKLRIPNDWVALDVHRSPLADLKMESGRWGSFNLSVQMLSLRRMAKHNILQLQICSF